MVHELKKRVESGKVLFGLKQALKNSKNLNRVMIPKDCREEIVSLFKEKNINVELMELTKDDVASKLELDFQCEVFGIEK